MSTTTLETPNSVATDRRGVITAILAWLKRKTATGTDHDVWAGGARGL